MITNYFISAFVLGVIVAIPPGSVTVIACQRAIQYGFRNSMVFTMGSSLSDIIYICLVYFGFTKFIQNDGSKIVLWVLCGLLLLLIGIMTVASAREEGGADAKGADRLQSRPWVTFVSGVVVTLTNPMTIIGWIAIAGNFFLLWKDRMPTGGAYTMITITAIMAGVLAWFIPMTFAVSKMRSIINLRFQKYLVTVSGLFLIIFGIISLFSAYRMMPV